MHGMQLMRVIPIGTEKLILFPACFKEEVSTQFNVYLEHPKQRRKSLLCSRIDLAMRTINGGNYQYFQTFSTLHSIAIYLVHVYL